VPKISYLNGKFLPHEEALVPIEDRGFQFADGVYEVVPFFNATMFEFDSHYDRLERSLGELKIKNPLSREVCRDLFKAMIEKNTLSEGIVYLQITRGVAPRDHAFPKSGIAPTVVATAKALDMDLIKERNREGVSVILYPENRWARRDIKSISLLGNVLAKEAAVQAGGYEAWFIEADGTVTEGTASNAWIATSGGVLVTRKADHTILSGITRMAVLNGGGGVTGIEERPFTADEAKSAQEAFLTSTTSCVMPVVKIDDTVIGNGRPGQVTQAAQKAFTEIVKEQTGYTGL